MDEKELLRRRKDRAIAIVLSFKEQHIDPQIDKQDRARLRKVILDQFNDFYHLVLDVLPDSTGMVFNDEVWVQKLEEMHAALCPPIPVDPRVVADLEPSRPDPRRSAGSFQPMRDPYKPRVP